MKYRVKTDVVRALIDNNARTIRQLAHDAGLSHSILVLVSNGSRTIVQEDTAEKMATAFFTEVSVICEPMN
jgi:hypothetical protein